MSNYDIVAPYYDRLSRLVFGNKLKDAQQYLIEQIKAGGSILIVGGGDGWVLEAIERHCNHDLAITYIDSSEKMIALARRRDTGKNRVNFIAGKVEDIDLPEMCDYVFTAFLFDNFSEDLCNRIFYKISGHLKPRGLWLYVDFTNSDKLRHRFLLGFMYVIFRLLCGVEARKLPEMGALFNSDDYHNTETKKWMEGFIMAQVFVKKMHNDNNSTRNGN